MVQYGECERGLRAGPFTALPEKLKLARRPGAAGLFLKGDELTVLEENPYQTPSTFERMAVPRPEPVFRSRTQAVLAGAWRGAKFGGKWPAIILTILMVAIWAVYLGMIVSLWLLRGTGFWQTLKPLEFLKMVGLSLGSVLYVTFVTGMVGGVIMGVAAGISYRKGATRTESDHEAKEPCSTDQPSG
jgi:hypothetical protein